MEGAPSRASSAGRGPAEGPGQGYPAHPARKPPGPWPPWARLAGWAPTPARPLPREQRGARAPLDGRGGWPRLAQPGGGPSALLRSPTALAEPEGARGTSRDTRPAPRRAAPRWAASNHSIRGRTRGQYRVLRITARGARGMGPWGSSQEAVPHPQYTRQKAPQEGKRCESSSVCRQKALLPPNVEPI